MILFLWTPLCKWDKYWVSRGMWLCYLIRSYDRYLIRSFDRYLIRCQVLILIEQMSFVKYQIPYWLRVPDQVLLSNGMPDQVACSEMSPDQVSYVVTLETILITLETIPDQVIWHCRPLMMLTLERSTWKWGWYRRSRRGMTKVPDQVIRHLPDQAISNCRP